MRARQAVLSQLFVVALWAGQVAHAQTLAPAVPSAPLGDQDAPTVTARLLQSEAHVGDALTLVVTAVAPEQVPVNLPANLDVAPFELIDRAEGEKVLGDGKRQRVFTFHIAVFEPGPQTVPAISLTYLAKQGSVRTVSTLPITLTIKSVLANEPDPALKQDAAPVAVMEDVRWPLYVGGGLLTAMLGAVLGSFLLSRWRRRGRVKHVPPPRPAHEVALEKLERLSAGFTLSEDMRPFYFELSETLREYFGGRYGFESLELTTDELLFELRRHGRKPLILSEVEGWLSSCDLVKFARVVPTADESQAALDAGIKFVVTTRPVPQPIGPTAPEGSSHE